MGIEQMEKGASAMTYVGSGTAVIGGLTAVELATYIGAGIAVLSFLFNQYWQYKMYRLNRETQLKELCEGCDKSCATEDSDNATPS